MGGFWVGPSDPQVFMDTFMKTKQKLPEKKLSKVDFNNVPANPTLERDVYVAVIDSIANHKLLPKGFVFHDMPVTSDDSTQLKPSVSLSLDDLDSGSWRWDPMEMWIDVRVDDAMDAFRVDCHDTSAYLDDVSDPEGKHTQHHLITFAMAQLDRQHRTFMFSLVICGTRVRFIRWDRAGAIVTKHFDLREDPQLLAQFFWRYGRLSRVDRGFDYTAQAATDKQKQDLASAIDTYLSQESSRVVPGMERTVDSDFPCHILTLADYHGGARQFVVQRPFSSSSTTVGRATRAYIALDTTSDQLVFLKDYWRPVEARRTAESEVYSSLQQADVPHLPHVRYGGDVPDVHDPFQTTITQDWQGRPGMVRCADLKGYRHHRIVQDIAFSLKTARSSRELVAAVRNTVQCIASAHGANWMHRDVSERNIMLDEYAQGFLNDWDHAVQLMPGEDVVYPRTGTWQFLSCALLSSPKKSHDVLDDLESCYWVLLFSALRHFESNALPKDFKIFDHYDDSNDLSEDMTGGSQKMGFLFWPKRLCFDSKPLDDLLERLRQTFKLYCSFGADGGSRCPAPQDAWAHVLQLLDDALSRSDWPLSDAVADSCLQTADERLSSSLLGWQSLLVRGWGETENGEWLTELAMCGLSAEIRSSRTWSTDYLDNEVRDEWIRVHADHARTVETPSGPINIVLDRKHVDYVIDELSGYAALRDHKNNCEVSSFERIWESSFTFSSEVMSSFDFELQSIRNAQSVTYPSQGAMFRIIDPYRYPIRYTQTVARVGEEIHPVLPPVPPPVDGYTLSTRFACIPTPYSISPSGEPLSCRALSYINSVDPSNTSLCGHIETIVARSIPLFEHVLTDLHRDNPLHQRIRGSCRYTEWDEPEEPEHSDDEEGWANYEREMRTWTLQRPLSIPDLPDGGYPGGLEEKRTVVNLRGKTVKVLLQVTDIHLTPERPQFPGTPCHVAGMRNEHIVACAFHCISSVSLIVIEIKDDSQISSFQSNVHPLSLAFHMPICSPLKFTSGDEGATARTWGLRHGSPSIQSLGKVPFALGRSVAFPNVYQHAFLPTTLIDQEKEGRTSVVGLFLVDPELEVSAYGTHAGSLRAEGEGFEILTTSHVPPQQFAWIKCALEESLDVRIPNEILERIMHFTKDWLMSDEEADDVAKEMWQEREWFRISHDRYWFNLPFDVWSGEHQL
ncbi:hypothetical protein EIP91_002697 [Steccherinum ochraceum]|uniref:Uncharacterized protein n=1 Tax=Steccherinum ochraceum TaxID=92696 RepID=A0A4R0RBU5_9APHY|nr:hypothetical protein EIP91_002697 [Steccherinum ochraceum]